MGQKCILLETLLKIAQDRLQTGPGSAKSQLIHEIDSLEIELRQCANKKITITDNYQKLIEVEWESGLAQDGGTDNQAVQDNIKGNSFGFFTAGHTLGDVIWNWPTVDDRVHVEGIWIWDRGHNAPTEIHPPHFISVQRKLPVSLIIDAEDKPVIRNQPNDKYIATRVDVFASADGTAMWNSKGLETFAQTVDMKRKDYMFTIKHPFQKPTLNNFHNVSLQCKFLKQKSDNFPADPIMEIENGIVTVTIPWHTANISSNAIFARTFVVYWKDDPANDPLNNNAKITKVLETEKPKLYKVDIKKVNLLTKMDGGLIYSDTTNPGNHIFGDFRIFCNIGSNWIFLNEFDPTVNRSNILQSGLGKALNVSTFQINKSFMVYVANNANSAFRISAKGWEADGGNILMGHIIDEYLRNPKWLSHYFGDKLLQVKEEGKDDDDIGNLDKMFNPLNIGSLNRPSTLQAFDGNGRNIFNIVYQITEIPFSATFTVPIIRN